MQRVWLLTGAIGVIGSNSLLLSPIAAEVASSFAGHSAADVMLAASLYGGGTAASALFLGPRADRIGLGRTLVAALCGLCLALGLSAAAPQLWALCLAQLAAGICAGLALPAIYALAADVAPKERESETLGKVLTGWTLSLVFGVSLSAILADIAHWRAVYGLLAVGAAGLVMALGQAGMARRTGHIAAKSSVLGVVRIPGLAPAMLSVVSYMAAFYGLYGYLGAHLTGPLGLSTSVAGLAALAYGLGFGGVAPLDRLIDRHGAVRAAPFVFGALVTVYLALALGSASGAAIIAMCVLWGAANHLGLNILVGTLTALSPERRGAILSLYSAVTYAAMSAGTAAFKPLYAVSGFAACALVCATLIMLCLALAWRASNCAGKVNYDD